MAVATTNRKKGAQSQSSGSDDPKMLPTAVQRMQSVTAGIKRLLILQPKSLPRLRTEPAFVARPTPAKPAAPRILQFREYLGTRRHNSHQIMTEPHTLHNAFSFALYFRILRLQHVRVALRQDGYAWAASCTEQDGAAIARLIQEKIADPDGARAHTREYEQRQAIAKARKAADAAEAEASRAERQRRKQLKNSTLRS
ncbi:MAG: hypothetical protein LQ346_008308 [Caloplaca aetnensis]|nr:MAG: hypothetical protein LQ346_008308 [Caloplaca aetnensis]